MMKKTILITMLLCLGIMIMMAGCSSEPQQPAGDQITFSNLTETSVQEEVADLMTGAGISDARQDVFFDHVNQFNQTVEPDDLTKGYETAGIMDMKYDPYAMQDAWMNKYPDFLGYNCRITAYSLFGDFIAIPLGEEVRDDMILMDLSALEEDASAMEVVDGDLERFKILYSTIPTEATKDVTVHAAKVKADWHDRGIRFPEKEKVSLITVWFHDQLETDELFIGHVGVLFDTADGLCFVEKLAFQEPYQVVNFKNRAELQHYMMTKYDFSEGQPTAPPFVMENDQLMEGYREKPANE